MAKKSNIPARFQIEDKEGNPVWKCNVYAHSKEQLIESGIEVFDDEEDITEEQKYISMYLEEAEEYSLVTEVATWALLAMKENPQLTPAMAMRLGFDEWVK